MAKPELGKKHVCHSCGAHYYDLNAEKVKCPKCGKAPKKSKVAEVIASEVVEEIVTETSSVVELDANGNEVVSLEDLVDDDLEDDDLDEDDEENGLIADASDLGEDDDDLSEVMEHIDEGTVDTGD
ncbi:MAG: FYDLN acid domain-containing protein [Rhodospirillales bacterium]|nr:FYDLN acid domain-containing protein [Rhodospirillales bacterium]